MTLRSTILRSNYFSAVTRNWRICPQVISLIFVYYLKNFCTSDYIADYLFAQTTISSSPSWRYRRLLCFTLLVERNTFPLRITWMHRSSAKVFCVVEKSHGHSFSNLLFDKCIFCQNPIRSWQFSRLNSFEFPRKEFLKT